MRRFDLAPFVLVAGTLLLAAAATGCARRPVLPAERYRPDRDGRVHVAVAPFARTGPVSGYMQTPTGGAAGTTVPGRPTLTEMGVDHAVEYGARAKIDYGRHRGRIEVSDMLLHGDGTLTEDLVSQGRPFPAGTRVNSDSNLTSINLGYSYLFHVNLGAGDRLELRPGIGWRAVGVHYRLDGSNGQRASRHYTPTGPNVDLQWAWRPRGIGKMRFSGYLGRTLEFQFDDDLQQFEIFEATARANWDFSSRGSVFLETGYRHMLLQDDQPTLQNRILNDYGPWLGIGGELRF